MNQKSILEHLQTLVPNAKKFVIAVSGGADSVALLRLFFPKNPEVKPNISPELSLKYLLSKTEKELALKLMIEGLYVAHFDHALREDSGLDATFVKELCQQLNVPFFIERVDVAKIAKEKKWNLEDTARRLRYSFLTRISKRVKADFVLTAHTLDDQAETVLMQLLRGAAHLTGMREVQGNIIRPLLNVSKKEVLEYLTSINQDFRTDESNFDTTRTRAWLRHDIFPRLEQHHSHVKKTLAQLAVLQRENEQYLEQQSQRLFLDRHIDLELLRGAHPSVQRQAIAHLLKQSHAPVTKDALERILELLGETETVQVSLSSTQSAALSAGTLRVIQKGGNPKFVQPDNKVDETFMRQALKLAVEAAKQGELPVGCVIVKDNQIIAEAHNETETTKDPTAHAEVLATRGAAEKLGDWRLEGCTLYVTLEPCPMCFGTILQAHVSKVVYGARNTRDGALGSVTDMQDAPWKRKVEIKSGILAKECGKLLAAFFEKKR